MPRTPDGALAALTPARPPPTLVNFGREEINPDAMDDVIMRLFRELNRQLVLLENTKPENIKETSDHERRARILASLERTMERLTTLEAGRAAQRKSQANVKDETKRIQLSKLTILIEAQESGESDQGADGG
jgi:hypothetical protein